MSPSYAAAFVMQQAAQSMSPTFDMYRFPFAPGSPLQVIIFANLKTFYRFQSI